MSIIVPMSSQAFVPGVFLDRDGVLIENKENYVRTWEDVEVFEQALVACREISEAGFPIIVVTNQSSIGRGILTYETVLAIHNRVIDVFRAAGANVLSSYICHHSPTEDCDCRKPKAGMLFQGAKEHNIDLERSFMVGDALTDMQAARTAGAQGILVRTGRGSTQEALMDGETDNGWIVCNDLLEASRYIVGRKDLLV